MKRDIDSYTIIEMIKSVLSEADGEFIAEIANKVLYQSIEYIEDDIFEIED